MFAIYLQYISPCYGVSLFYSVSQYYGILSYGVSLFKVLEEGVLMVYIFSHANFYGTKVNIGSVYRSESLSGCFDDLF